MTVRARFSLDTNILVYAVDRDAVARHEAAKSVVARAAMRDCILTIQALAEFFHATTRKKLLTPTAAADFVHDWLSVFDTAAADQAVLAEAMETLQSHSWSFWDAMLWATVKQAGCAAILSEDMQDGRKLGGVEIVNPFGPNATDRLAPWLDP